MMLRKTFVCFLFGLTCLTGCSAVGPEYSRPEIEMAGQWQGATGGTIADDALLARWWTTFQDPLLSELVAEATANNLDVHGSRSRVRQARLERIVTSASQLPGADGRGAAQKSYSAGDGESAETDTFSAGFDASWEIDLFGGVRRSVQASQADYEASVEELRDVLVSLVAEVAQDYVDVRSYQARLAITKEQIDSQSETLSLLQALGEAGRGDELAIAQARSNLESARATMPELELSLENSISGLAILTAKSSRELRRTLAESAPVPAITVSPAVGVPADLLRRRPDIRKAEQQYLAETARIGKAEAELYPKLSLSGSIGLQSASLDDLVGSPTRLWSFGPSLSVPVFNGGALRNQVKIQTEVQLQALYSYKLAVMTAAEEVENALAACTKEQEKLGYLEKALKAAKDAEELSRTQYLSGMIDFTDVLDAQRSTLSLRNQVAQSSAQVVSDVISLYKALGGGWEVASAPPGN